MGLVFSPPIERAARPFCSEAPFFAGQSAPYRTRQASHITPGLPPAGRLLRRLGVSFGKSFFPLPIRLVVAFASRASASAARQILGSSPLRYTRIYGYGISVAVFFRF